MYIYIYNDYNYSYCYCYISYIIHYALYSIHYVLYIIYYHDDYCYYHLFYIMYYTYITYYILYSILYLCAFICKWMTCMLVYMYIHISIVCMFGPRSLQNQVDSRFFKYDYALLNARRRLSCRTESTCMFLSQAITSYHELNGINMHQPQYFSGHCSSRARSNATASILRPLF